MQVDPRKNPTFTRAFMDYSRNELFLYLLAVSSEQISRKRDKGNLKRTGVGLQLYLKRGEEFHFPTPQEHTEKQTPHSSDGRGQQTCRKNESDSLNQSH